MAIKTVNEESLIALGDAIREKTGGTEGLEFPSEMTEAIKNFAVISNDDLILQGDCGYRFYNDGWTHLINKHGNLITTKDITDYDNMFKNCKELTYIPFELNTNGKADLEGTFMNCYKLKAIPRINNCIPIALKNLFCNCNMLRSLPDDFEDWFDWSFLEGESGKYTNYCDRMFGGCYSLRTIPTSLFSHLPKEARYNYTYFYQGFDGCSSLDELENLPVLYVNSDMTSNMFHATFSQCGRLKNITFQTNEDGTPIIVRWKAQTINTRYNGYSENDTLTNQILNYNSGITADKEVIDDVTYQQLKNDPDWFSRNIAYSRYNHTSAVKTINSLPDASAYLATAGGTNTIVFQGIEGSATDGGAINTLTEEEIAVATAKGWTVSIY